MSQAKNTYNKKRIAKTIGIMNLLNMLSTDDKVLAFFEAKIWNNGVYCPRCKGVEKLTKQKDNHNYWCGKCRKYFNVRTNTPLENSNITLRKWIIAIYLLMTARKGISSLQLSKELDITQKSAWFLTQRIRECFAYNNDNMLTNIVEVDETYIGGLESNKHRDKRVKGTQGRSNKTKIAVLGMKQRKGKVIAHSLNKTDSKTIQKSLDKHIKKDGIISTDEARFYKPIKHYKKVMVNHSVSEFVNGMASTNSIESVWANLKRGYNGVYHHFSKKHIDRYINEFTFRLNEGTCQIDTLDRIDSVIDNMQNNKLGYKELIKE